MLTSSTIDFYDCLGHIERNLPQQWPLRTMATGCGKSGFSLIEGQDIALIDPVSFGKRGVKQGRRVDRALAVSERDDMTVIQPLTATTCGAKTLSSIQVAITLSARRYAG